MKKKYRIHTMIRRPACPVEAFNLIKGLVETVENKYDIDEFPNYHKLILGLGVVIKNKLISKIPEYAQRNMFSRIILNSGCPIFQKFIIEPEHYEKLYKDSVKNSRYTKRLNKYKCLVENVTSNAKECLKRNNIDEELRCIATDTILFFEDQFLYDFIKNLFACLKSLRKISKYIQKRCKDTFLKYNTFSSSSSLSLDEAEDIARQFE